MTHQEETSGKILSDEEAKRIAERTAKLGEGMNHSRIDWRMSWLSLGTHYKIDTAALLSDREARIQRNREGIEKMFAKMCELDTPKRGELHLLLISLFY